MCLTAFWLKGLIGNSVRHWALFDGWQRVSIKTEFPLFASIARSSRNEFTLLLLSYLKRKAIFRTVQHKILEYLFPRKS